MDSKDWWPADWPDPNPATMTPLHQLIGFLAVLVAVFVFIDSGADAWLDAWLVVWLPLLGWAFLAAVVVFTLGLCVAARDTTPRWLSVIAANAAIGAGTGILLLLTFPLWTKLAVVAGVVWLLLL